MKFHTIIKPLFYLLSFVCIVMPTAYPHSGRTDAQGGHANKKTGEYHFHNKPKSNPSTTPQTNLTVEVLSIVDGDTLKISYKGQNESVRLIGIDTPESRVNKKTKKDAKRSGQDIEAIIALGKRATAYVESLVKPGDNITIVFDVQERDRYGRLLCYVYLSNGKMLNEEIVKAGYANVMTVPPNVKYKDIFLKAYQVARESKRGLWEE
jgi:micrococcal nuclease